MLIDARKRFRLKVVPILSVKEGKLTDVVEKARLWEEARKAYIPDFLLLKTKKLQQDNEEKLTQIRKNNEELRKLCEEKFGKNPENLVPVDDVGSGGVRVYDAGFRFKIARAKAGIIRERKKRDAGNRRGHVDDNDRSV